MKEIRNIISTYEGIDHSKEKVALASVVSVEESSYRRIGARMLVRSSGLWVGGISGGCLEGDALRRSQQAIFRNKPSLVVYDTMEDDKNQIGVGLGCNGRIEVLLSPINPDDPENEIEMLKKIEDADGPSLMLKIIESDSAPDWLGKNKLVYPVNNDVDFAGIDNAQLKVCLDEVISKKKARIFEVDSAEIGHIKLLVEFIRPETRLVIVGDNYDVNAMVGLADQMGWDITIVGKAKKLSAEVFEMASKIIDKSQAEDVSVNEYTAVVLMSHDYKTDKTLLPLFQEKKPAYIGMLGPKKRFVKIENELGSLTEKDHKMIHSPTGLEIGAESPQEIALSILSEIVAVFRGKTGTSLKHKEGTIHEREQVVIAANSLTQ